MSLNLVYLSSTKTFKVHKKRKFVLFKHKCQQTHLKYQQTQKSIFKYKYAYYSQTV